jgi:two-component system response regulator YesN
MLRYKGVVSMLKVLIIDDEYLVRIGLRTTIDWKEYGMTVVGEAENGQQGIELAIRYAPDIILTDISMPILNGIEMMRQLRELRMSAKIIVLSGYSDFSYAKSAIEQGVSGYILKPIENEQLIEALLRVSQAIQQDQFSDFIVKRKLVLDIIKLLKKIRLQKTNTSSKLVNHARQLIHVHFEQELSVKWLADQLYISPYYLMHIFKETTQMTVKDYVSFYRIEKAKEYLRADKYKIYEVGAQVGYPDPQYFSQIFKKYTQLSPRQFIKHSLYGEGDLP